MVKYSFLMLVSFFCYACATAQDVAILMKEAENLELSFKEPEALEKYKEALSSSPNNVKALIKAASLRCSIGARSTNKNDKRLQYESGLVFAKRALATDSNNADVAYTMGVASGKMTEVETDNKKIVAYANDSKLYADKALAINPKHSRALFAEGRWHYEMVTLPVLKRAAVKVLYGGLPTASLDSAIGYMEKCRAIDPYFMLDYYYLNKAYKEDNRLEKQIEVLNKMVKLPTRCFDDISMKEEANRLLAELQ